MDILGVCTSISSVLCCFIDYYDSSPTSLPTRVGGTNNRHDAGSHFCAFFEVLAAALAYGDLRLGEGLTGRVYYGCVGLDAECADWALLAG